MKTLYLMRHGQTLFNQKRLMQGFCDAPLTMLGKQQASNVKEYFKDHQISFKEAYCSTSERANDTLELITDAPYQRVKGLKEWNFGIFEGESDDLDPPFPFGDFFKQFQGEGENEVIERVSTTILDIIQKTKEETILMVSHGLSCYCFAKKWRHNHKVEMVNGMPNCGILKFEFEDNQFYLVEVIDANASKEL